MKACTIRKTVSAFFERFSYRPLSESQGPIDFGRMPSNKPGFGLTSEALWRHLAVGADLFLLLSCFVPEPVAFASVAETKKMGVRQVIAYRIDWRDGIDPRITRQEPDQNAITVVSVPESVGPACKISIDRSHDYSSVANGSPRAELAFERVARFAVGVNYEIRWSTMIPRDYGFDRKQPEIITQIHQSSSSGSPPFALMLAGDKYQLDVRGRHDAKNIVFGDAGQDRGRKNLLATEVSTR